MAKIYIKTSIPSYVSAEPSGSVIAAARQILARDWWNGPRLVNDCFISDLVILEASKGDALHISIAIVHGMDYLVTWNCRHIANSHIVKKIRKFLDDKNFVLPEIATPEELLGV
jgi:hypothetical protein